ncbi:MAG: head GIN domain-containing protein [Rubrivivax sp.]|nr:head GIN domain-containing protein [Rubrivivax sp.]MDP3615222.1 head GIN domain-containing protein [Rubrivivax sp.]
MTPSLRQTLAHLVAPALLCLTLLPHAAQANTPGSVRSVSELRTVDSFQAIALSGSMDLTVRQGAEQSVQVEADDKLLPLLETVVESTSRGATLLVRWKKGHSLSSRSRVRVTVVVPKLTALVAAGSGDIRLEPFNTPVLKLALSGSGDARLTGLTTDELGISISGSGDVAGSGSAVKIKVSIAGSGDVRLSDMKADDVTVSIAGSGDAAVNADKSLSVTIAGSGDVSYTGNAAVKSRVAGSGSVVKR